MSETPPQIQGSIEKARAELLAFKQENDLKTEGSRDPHWQYIDLDKLSEEEAEIWNLIQTARGPEDADALTEKINDYRSRVNAKLREVKLSRPGLDVQKTHESAMIAWLANKAQTKITWLFHDENFDRR